MDIDEFRREIKWEPGYDHRNDPEKNKYGCHGMQIRWLLHGKRATVQFLLFTDWLPTWKEFDKNLFGILPADIGYHADHPQYEGQDMGKCEYRGGKCHYGGSGLMANDVFKILINDGEEAVWKYMEEYYKGLICVAPSQTIGEKI